jgi:hypothetical protein
MPHDNVWFVPPGGWDVGSGRPIDSVMIIVLSDALSLDCEECF